MQNIVKMQKPTTGTTLLFCCQYIPRVWTQCPGFFFPYGRLHSV